MFKLIARMLRLLAVLSSTFNVYIIILMVQIKLSFDLYLAKFLNISAKMFFPYMLKILKILK